MSDNQMLVHQRIFNYICLLTKCRNVLCKTIYNENIETYTNFVAGLLRVIALRTSTKQNCGVPFHVLNRKERKYFPACGSKMTYTYSNSNKSFHFIAKEQENIILEKCKGHQ